jgi:hypothetical protein
VTINEDDDATLIQAEQPDTTTYVESYALLTITVNPASKAAIRLILIE